MSGYKARGSPSNPLHRYNQLERISYPGERTPDYTTQLYPEFGRQLLSHNQSPDVPFNLSINPYRGCEHGCIYCFARPSHAYLDLSPGLDFERKIIFKPNAVDLLKQALRKPSYQCQPIALGPNTDAYQPAERQLTLTRQLLKVCLDFNQPVTLLTKSNLILHDLDLLQQLHQRQLVSIAISITSLDLTIKASLEPRAAAPKQRLATLRALAAAGLPTTVLVAPVIPWITDHELEGILEASAQAGVTHAGYTLLRLPHELTDLFSEWLTQHYPERQAKVLNTLKACRNGRLNDPRFHHRVRGQGIFAELIARRFRQHCQRLGLNRHPRPKLNTRDFSPPLEPGDQYSLF